MTPRDTAAVAETAALGDAEAWIFDLDNTLYPPSIDLFGQIDRRMCGYIAEFLGIDRAEAYRIQKSFFREHGTTLKGMMTVHNMPPEPYLDYVHAIDVGVLAPNPRLKAALDRLEGRKFVFTNASARHAERVLDQLGIAGAFEAVFDIVAAAFVPKPDPAVYAELVTRHGIRPERAVMVEDVARNLAPARAMGMTTVWLASDKPWAGTEGDVPAPDHRIDDLTRWLEGVAGCAAEAAPRA